MLYNHMCVCEGSTLQAQGLQSEEPGAWKLVSGFSLWQEEAGSRGCKSGLSSGGEQDCDPKDHLLLNVQLPSDLNARAKKAEKRKEGLAVKRQTKEHLTRRMRHADQMEVTLHRHHACPCHQSWSGKWLLHHKTLYRSRRKTTSKLLCSTRLWDGWNDIRNLLQYLLTYDLL